MYLLPLQTPALDQEGALELSSRGEGGRKEMGAPQSIAGTDNEQPPTEEREGWGKVWATLSLQGQLRAPTARAGHALSLEGS